MVQAIQMFVFPMVLTIGKPEMAVFGFPLHLCLFVLGSRLSLVCRRIAITRPWQSRSCLKKLRLDNFLGLLMSSVKMIWLISANQETGFRCGHVLHGRPYELATGQLPPGLHKIVFWGSFQGFDCLFSFFITFDWFVFLQLLAENFGIILKVPQKLKLKVVSYTCLLLPLEMPAIKLLILPQNSNVIVNSNI